MDHILLKQQAYKIFSVFCAADTATLNFNTRMHTLNECISSLLEKMKIRSDIRSISQTQVTELSRLESLKYSKETKVRPNSFHVFRW